MRFAGLGVATKMLALIDDSLSLLSQARLLADMATSRLLERWEVKSNKAKVKLSPEPLAMPSDTEFPVTAFAKEPLPPGTMVDWTWSHAGVGSVAALPPWRRMGTRKTAASISTRVRPTGWPTPGRPRCFATSIPSAGSP